MVDIRPQLEQFASVIIWKQIGRKKVPEPIPGLDQTYDKANQNVDDIKEEFNDLLKQTKKEFDSDIIGYWTTSSIYRFQFEIPRTEKTTLELFTKAEGYEKVSTTHKSVRYQNNELKLLGKSPWIIPSSFQTHRGWRKSKECFVSILKEVVQKIL